MWFVRLMAAAFVVSGAAQSVARGEQFVSHPPTRPLPVSSHRPLGAGPTSFVDAARGSDQNDGSRDRPWKTAAHAVKQLRPGDTLCLRGGTYYEHVTVTVSGAPGKPITIRAHPGELAVLDGGLREFFEEPAKAWEPFTGGTAGEYRSVKAYPGLGGDATHSNLLGRFGDSMVPLHGYHTLHDLRSNNEFWNLDNKVGRDEGIWCGPGIFFDVATGRIHARLAHTRLKGLGDDNYRGETDPRKLALVIAGHAGGPVLAVRGAKHLRFQDLVVRGAREAAIDVFDSADIELDGITAYGGSAPMRVLDTVGFRLLDSACRGIAAPWTFRTSLKYRAIEARLFAASGWEPTGADNRDFELAHSEFTDSVDGIFIGNIRGVKFHHNLLDNVSDDGIFLTAGTAYDGTTPGGDIHIYQNLLSRCLTTFAFGVGHGRQKALANGRQTGAGVRVYRNVFDQRRPVPYFQPKGPDEPQELTFRGRLLGDHGSPTWEPIDFYHNTVVNHEPPFRGAYGAGLGGGMGRGTRRRVFNNVFIQSEGVPGAVLPAAALDFQADGNLHWGFANGSPRGDLFARFRALPDFAESKKRYSPGWVTHDRVADPKFVRVAADWRTACDLRPAPDSPVVDAGVDLPTEWLDPVKPLDRDKPDLGALPLGAEPWHVGVKGRLTLFGGEK